ncbi:nucleotidyltransferase family protein [Ramlibacter albus]|uniref:NTP transferase domain-containing protein n=1 Tax=Ramlibacter albus TaxID=2079448 RepID=A0A923MAR8_9BURK|nr:NTP transferase domain-containing protein [Ramlibacter albus]MBC5765899.1 NTP transferase domain-containing protein [Ramlibacter albus]
MGMPTVLVLASGRGERFVASGGTGSKLQALLAGKPVLERTLEAVRASGLPWHLEDAGHPGMGDSIAAAVAATRSAYGWLVLPGDLPLIRPDTLVQVAKAIEDHVVVLPVYGGQRGHPVGFSIECRDALMGLAGPDGAAHVVRAYSRMKLAYHLQVDDPGTVADVDTVADLQDAERLLRS